AGDGVADVLGLAVGHSRRVSQRAAARGVQDRLRPCRFADADRPHPRRPAEAQAGLSRISSMETFAVLLELTNFRSGTSAGCAFAAGASSVACSILAETTR